MELKESERRLNQKEFIRKWLIEEMNRENYKEEDNVKPEFKTLTKEQIDDIHRRGKITPQEKVEEWEGMDLCVPGDAIGSASNRCRTFSNCHDCLVDYAKQSDEYDSFIALLKENPFQNGILDDETKEDIKKKTLNK